MKFRFFTFLVLLVQLSFGQSSISDLLTTINEPSLKKLVRDLSGEQSTTVGGNVVTITHRVSNSGNELAANYIKEQLEATGLVVVEDVYASKGKNIIATQTGVTNPNEVYIIGAHYDSYANSGADDNASGTAAVIELARMLAPLCLEKTIIYALWDEEEIGLRGSKAHAQQLKNAGVNVQGVFNIDMMAYDNDGDNDFDIDVRPIANSIAFKDAIVNVLNTPSYNFTLNVNVVNPGTTSSDHSSFWNQGFSALLFGESWLNNDQTTGYHTANDRDNLFNYPYYNQMFKLVVASMATFVKPIFIDKSITQTTTSLTANVNNATYQWIDCNAGNVIIPGATTKVYTPIVAGSYAVQITKNGCMQTSECVTFNTLSTEEVLLQSIKVSPNPVKNIVSINGLEKLDFTEGDILITDVQGKEMLYKKIDRENTQISVNAIASGIYILQITLDTSKKKKIKFIKE